MHDTPTPETDFTNLQYRSCPACGLKESFRYLEDINRREGLSISGAYVRCPQCRTMWLNPAPTWEAIEPLYEYIYLHASRKIYPRLNPDEVRPALKEQGRSFSKVGKLLRFVNGMLRGHPHDFPDEDGNGRSILDFGCADAAKLVRWYQRGWRVAGIDVNPGAIEVARLRFPDGKFYCDDVTKLNVPQRYDVVRADNVLEHVMEPKEILLALSKMLVRGGRIYIYVPYADSLSVVLFRRFSISCWVPMHLTLFTRKGLRYLLEGIGFKDIRMHTFCPIGSWAGTQRQLLLPPGFDFRDPDWRDRWIKRLYLLNYPGECLAQWCGLGEELVAIATAP